MPKPIPMPKADALPLRAQGTSEAEAMLLRAQGPGAEAEAATAAATAAQQVELQAQLQAQQQQQQQLQAELQAQQQTQQHAEERAAAAWAAAALVQQQARQQAEANAAKAWAAHAGRTRGGMFNAPRGPLGMFEIVNDDWDPPIVLPPPTGKAMPEPEGTERTGTARALDAAVHRGGSTLAHAKGTQCVPGNRSGRGGSCR